MKKRLKRKFKTTGWFTISILSIMTLLLIAIIVYLSLSVDNKTEKAVSKPIIALVNEDKASEFNKKPYHFGKDFVSLVSGDTKYNWQVVSRSVADRAYADKSVDAVIYIPQTFSHDILTLQDINPVKSQVNYQLQSGQSTLSHNLLNDKIATILKDFNKNIVKMYYASVAGNISEAQNNMSDVIGNQTNVLTTLSNQIYSPFQTTNQNYAAVIASANGLQLENTAWISAQNSFTNTTQSMLDATSKTFSGQLPGLQKYFDTQKQITDTNLINANNGITNQSDNDQKVYYKQFSDAKNNTVNHLLNFYKNDTAPSGIFFDLQNQVTDYNTKITDVRERLSQQIAESTDNRNQLLQLENRLYQQFFAQSIPVVDLSNFDQKADLNGEMQNDTNAHEALYQKIRQSFSGKDKFSQQGYLSNLKILLAQYSWDVDDYQKLFKAMNEQNIDTTQYSNALRLISSYGNAIGARPGTVDFSDIPTDNNNVNQTIKKTMQITVPAGKNYTVVVADGVDKVTLDDVRYDRYPEASIVKNGNKLELHNKDHGTDKEENKRIAVFNITYTVSLGQSKEALVTFKWGEKSNENSVSSRFFLQSLDEIKEALGGDKLGTLTQVLNNIEKSATLITWLYGSSSDTIDTLESYFSSGSYTVDDFKNYNTTSLANLYGNTDRDDLKQSLASDDISVFKIKGHENIDQVIQSIRSFNENITTLTDAQNQLGENLPTNVFSQNLTALQEWYDVTMQSIEKNFDSWEKNEPQTLVVKPWESYNSNDTVLYQDTAASDALYKTISDLSSSTAKNAAETAKSAQLIKDNANEFSQMVSKTQETKASAEKLLGNTNDLLVTGNVSLIASQKYNSNFGKILANTRNENANKNQLFDFFAQPLNIKNMTPTSTVTKNKMDWRWPLVLILGIAIGLLASMSLNIFLSKKQIVVTKD